MEFEEQPIYQIITEIKGSDLPLEVKYGYEKVLVWNGWELGLSKELLRWQTDIIK